MVISKHVHSCLLVKDKGKMILIDPGEYSYEEKALDVRLLPQLDSILITHEHADHMFIPSIKEILQKFPTAVILSNQSVRNILAKENIETVDSLEGVMMTNIPHEKIFGGDVPENVQFDIFKTLTHPGDSLQIKTSLPVLALPVQAPWGSLVSAVEKAIILKPKVIIPIHDWHWNDKAREMFYARLKEYFAQFHIDFKSLKTGEEVTV